MFCPHLRVDTELKELGHHLRRPFESDHIPRLRRQLGDDEHFHQKEPCSPRTVEKLRQKGSTEIGS